MEPQDIEFLVFLQDLTLQPWGTFGEEPEGEVRVFFVRGPTVQAGTGTVTFAKLYCWGDDSFGQLGIGSTDGFETDHGQLGNGAAEASDTPVEVTFDGSFITGAAGDRTACAVTDEHALYCWGDGEGGKLGVGDFDGNDADTPAHVPSLADVTAVTVGRYHACAVRDDGTVYCWGYNGSLALGTASVPDFEIAPVPVPIDTSYLESFHLAIVPAHISAGMNTTCVVNAAGPAFCWGTGVDGAVGSGVAFGPLRPNRVAATR